MPISPTSGRIHTPHLTHSTLDPTLSPGEIDDALSDGEVEEEKEDKSDCNIEGAPEARMIQSVNSGARYEHESGSCSQESGELGAAIEGSQPFIQRSEDVVVEMGSLQEDGEGDDASPTATLRSGSTGENQSDQDMEGGSGPADWVDIGRGLAPTTASSFDEYMIHAEHFLDSMKDILQPLPQLPPAESSIQTRWEDVHAIQGPSLQQSSWQNDPLLTRNPEPMAVDSPSIDEQLRAIIGAKYDDSILMAKWGLRRKDILVLQFDVDEEMAMCTRRWAAREDHFEYVMIPVSDISVYVLTPNAFHCTHMLID